MARARGRRPAGSHTRADIEAAAKRQFAEFGYPRTTLRGIAREAEVDTRLVTHYFGSKQQLFLSVLDFPFESDRLVEDLLANGPENVGHRLATLVISTLSEPGSRQTLVGLVRAAASEDEAAALVRQVLSERLLTPLARLLSGDRPELRAALIGSHVTGYLFGRFVVELPALVSTDRTELADAVAPVLQYYLTGELAASTGV